MSRVERIAHAPGAELGGEALDEVARATGSTTMKRLAAMQLWPLLMSRASAATFAACGEVGVGEDDERVASAELEHGLLDLAPRPLGDRLPACSLPVSVTAATRASAIRPPTAADPTSSVRKSPRGKPAAVKTLLDARARSCGTFEACLSRPALPAISAGAAKRKTCQKGKFHGMTASTMPSGSKRT